MKFVNEKLEEFNNYIKNKRVAIIGLGVSNIPLIDYLYNLGSNIVLFNNKPIDELDNSILDKIYNCDFKEQRKKTEKFYKRYIQVGGNSKKYIDSIIK